MSKHLAADICKVLIIHLKNSANSLVDIITFYIANINYSEYNCLITFCFIMKCVMVVIFLYLTITIDCRNVIKPEEYLFKLFNRTVDLTFEKSLNYPGFSDFTADFTGNNSKSLMNKNVVGTVNFHSGFITTIRKVELNKQNFREAFTTTEVTECCIEIV